MLKITNDFLIIYTDFFFLRNKNYAIENLVANSKIHVTIDVGIGIAVRINSRLKKNTLTMSTRIKESNFREKLRQKKYCP